MQRLRARGALDRFLDNDLFRAAREVEAAVEGTFGCVITSTLEPDVAVAFARGQPLSLGVQTDDRHGRDRLRAQRAARAGRARRRVAFDARLDFDLTNAEIARIATGDALQPQLSLYCAARARTYTHEELERSGRLVSLRDNPLTPPLPDEAKRARCARTWRTCRPSCARVRDDYNDPRLAQPPQRRDAGVRAAVARRRRACWSSASPTICGWRSSS